jgi:hypothetical protein
MIGGFPHRRDKRRSKRELGNAKALRALMAAGWDDLYPSLRDLLANLTIPAASEEERLQSAEVMRQIISPENMARERQRSALSRGLRKLLALLSNAGQVTGFQAPAPASRSQCASRAGPTVFGFR